MADLLSMFDSLESSTKPELKNREAILRAPFAYPGSKMRSVKKILPELPLYKRYVEPFGGSGVVLLNRPKSELEVLNDRYMGVVAFYRCLRDKDKLEKLIFLIENTVTSREDFVSFKATWDKDWLDDVERAYRWFYIITYSFGSLCRNFGRETNAKSSAGKMQNKIPHLREIQARLRNVYIENLDWETCIRDFDSPDTVFYIDPPYLESSPGVYKGELSYDDHTRLLDIVFESQGFCAVSSYQNQLYDSKPWDKVIDWEVFVSIKSMASNGNKSDLKDLTDRDHRTERLYIKERH